MYNAGAEYVLVGLMDTLCNKLTGMVVVSRFL